MSAKTGGDEDPVNEERAGIVREVGSQAVWSLSSCKPGITTGAMNQTLRAVAYRCLQITRTEVFYKNLKKIIQVSELNNCVIIVWTHTGNRMVNCRILSTFNSNEKLQLIRFTFTPIISWMKVIPPAKSQSDREHILTICRKSKL